jgi:hypothetical protein
MLRLARGRRAVVCAVWAAVHLGVSAPWAEAQEAVAPDESDACFTAAERAQPLMRQKRLREARVELEMCARDACPRVARSDCRSWLQNVINQQPTIVITGHEVRGNEVSDVRGIRATIDGAIIVENADATPVAIDPGPHRLHLEREGGDALEQDIDVRDGEKGRILHVYWRAAAPKGESPSPAPSPTPPAVYVFGGLGLASAGVGTYLEIAGWSKRNDLESTCKQTRSCGADQVNAAKDLFLAGDLTLGAGLVLVATAAYFYFARPAANASSRTGNIRWALGGTPRAFEAGLQAEW